MDQLINLSRYGLTHQLTRETMLLKITLVLRKVCRNKSKSVSKKVSGNSGSSTIFFLVRVLLLLVCITHSKIITDCESTSNYCTPEPIYGSLPQADEGTLAFDEDISSLNNSSEYDETSSSDYGFC
jgi:hypothetical protein